MDSNDKILAIENRIIDALTAFSWWTEVKFERNNFDFKVISLQGFLLFMSVSFGSGAIFLFKVNVFPEALIFSLIFLFHFLLLIYSFFAFSKIKEDFKKDDPKGSPNPNRYSRTQSILRRIYVFMAFFSFCMFVAHQEEVYLSFSLGFCFLSLFFFFGACDPIPPNKKKKRPEYVVSEEKYTSKTQLSNLAYALKKYEEFIKQDLTLLIKKANSFLSSLFCLLFSSADC